MREPVFAARSEPIEVELIRAQIWDLGFRNPPTTTELLDHIELIGFTTEEHQAAPASRLVAGRDDDFWVLSKPITGPAGYLLVWHVCGDDNESRLDADYRGLDEEWGLGGEFVLVRRKPA